jgi:hypothetical protein
MEGYVICEGWMRRRIQLGWVACRGCGSASRVCVCFRQGVHGSTCVSILGRLRGGSGRAAGVGFEGVW